MTSTTTAIDVTAHLGIARTVANRHAVADRDDLYGHIVADLVAAAPRYDASKGTVPSFLWTTAKFSALHYLRDHATTIRRDRAAFEAGEQIHTTSVDTPIGDGTATLADVVGTTDDRLDLAELRIDLAAALATLDERQRFVVLACDGEGRKQADVGADLGVSQGEVYRIRKAALARMRAVMAA